MILRWYTICGSERGRAMNRELRITLRSDLCAGSGFAYAGVIDQDISYDRNGIPYISGRRIKGCMREAAELIGVRDVDRLFGEWGSRDRQGIVIGNAYPERYRDIGVAMDRLRREQDKRLSYLTPENVLDYFTSVRTQTGLREGVAEDNSLRFTRVVGQFDRSSGEALVFCAPVLFPDGGKEVEEELEKIALATRHIGLHRNRGLGNVKMEFAPGMADKAADRGTQEGETREAEGCQAKIQKTEIYGAKQQTRSDTAGKKKIRYYVTNIQPLLLSSERDDVTDGYISGGRVRGALAGEYLRRAGCSDQDEDFAKLFLRDGTIFSNLTPVSETEGQTLYPAPLYLRKLKKTKDLVNIAVEEPETEGKEKDFGNLPKKIRGKYAAEYNGKWLVQEPRTEILYHHRRQGEAQLYFLEALSKEQTFCGEIMVDAGLSDLVLDLLKSARLCFGKSRSAQYGECRLTGNPIVSSSTGTEKKSCRKGAKVLVTFQSDGAFIDAGDKDGGENGTRNYTVDYGTVRACIAAEFNKAAGKTVLREDDAGQEAEKGGTEDAGDVYGILEAGVAAGYNTKWNLQKPQFPVVRAGSAFGFVLADDLEKYPSYIGEHQLDGLGKVCIFDLDGAPYFVDKKEENPEEGNAQEKRSEDERVKKEIPDRETEELWSIYRYIVRKKLYEKLEYSALSKEHKLNIHASALGRLTLMLSESVNESRGERHAAVLAFRKLADRVDSIKAKDTREEIQSFLQKILGACSYKDGGETAFIGQITGKMAEAGGKTYADCLEAFGEEGQQAVFGLWPGYLQSVLNYQKYRMK